MVAKLLTKKYWNGGDWINLHRNVHLIMRQLSDLDQKANALRTYLMTNNYRGEETTKKYMELQDVERRIAQLRSSQNNIR